MARKPKTVRHRLADGSIKVYRYPRHRADQPAIGTLAAVIAEYKKSPEWTGLAESTQRQFLYAFDHLKPGAHKPLATLKPRNVLQIRDQFAGRPGTAHAVLAALSRVLSFAVARNYIDHNPARDIPRPKLGQWGRWPDDAIDQLLAVAPERIRRAVVLALASGQRESDLLRMTWNAYDGEGLRLTQQKTKEPLYVPLQQHILDELDRWKAEKASLHILHPMHKTGVRWQPFTFRHAFRKAMAGAGLDGQGLVFHGLRATAAAHLAEAGCSTHEIAAITGHRTLAMVQKYSQGAEQKRRATAAIIKLDAVRGDKRGDKRQTKT